MKVADAEEDNNDSEGAARNDDVEANAPRCIVCDGTANEWTQSESHALDSTTDGTEDRTVLQ